MAEAPHRETQGDKQPEAAQQLASSRVPVIAVSLAALAVIGAAAANSLPSFGRYSLPDFNQFSLPGVDWYALPDFSRFSPPNFNRSAAVRRSSQNRGPGARKDGMRSTRRAVNGFLTTSSQR